VRTVIVIAMPNSAHEERVQESFRQQVGAFSGPKSVYADREGALGWVEPLDASMVVLEVACGAAHASESIAASVHEVVGLDLTVELLNVGADRMRQDGVDNVILQKGNAEELPFVDGSFDVAFCRSSLHHFDDPQRAISEMTRVTKAGGRVVLLDLVAPVEVDRELFDELHRMLDPSHVRTFVEGELVDALCGATTPTYVSTSRLRFPIEVAISDISDGEGAIGALREDMAGGRRTGFEPADENGSLVVSFYTCIVQGTAAKL
jgi:SAM-dependent methyltransferase